jgi:Rps23 Pro-64 3,4-dihydroxylase Tpa1-like proline 4-hydroxylase
MGGLTKPPFYSIIIFSLALIKVFDNFFSEKEFFNIHKYCVEANYTYGERDNYDTPPVGMVSDIPLNSEICTLFQNVISKKISQVSDYNLYRCYINCFAPSENPYFHTDGDSGLTLLYYPNEEWNLNDNGETQILLNTQTDQIVGVLPIPNRMLLFDANLIHRATSFRDRHRFTIALKYN